MPAPMLTQLETTVECLAGGLVERLFLSHQRADPIPDFHTHPGEQFIVALEGESRLEILRGQGGKARTVSYPIREGDVAVLSARKPHRWITLHGELLALAINLDAPESCRPRPRQGRNEKFRRYRQSSRRGITSNARANFCTPIIAAPWRCPNSPNAWDSRLPTCTGSLSRSSRSRPFSRTRPLALPSSRQIPRMISEKNSP